VIGWAVLKKVNLIAIVGAVLVAVGFFFSWFAVGTGEEGEIISGFSVGSVAGDMGPAYYIVYLLPLLAVGVVALTFKKPRFGAVLAMITGGAFLLWGLYEVARFLFEVTFVGLWMTVIGCILLLLGGIVGFRFKAEAASEATPKASELPANTGDTDEL
jgi:hypothetical protein